MNLTNKYNLNLKPGEDFNIIENHWIPKKMGTEFFVFGKTMYCNNNMIKIPKHEFLHVAQFKKYGIFLVTLHYLFYISVNFIRYRNLGKAFSQIPFEIEARNFEKEGN